jgi:outer membrane protein
MSIFYKTKKFLIYNLLLFNVLHAQEFALRKVDNPKIISLNAALLMAEQNNKDLLIANEQIAIQKANRKSALAFYLPKLELGSTFTANFPEIKAKLLSEQQTIQQAQNLETLANLTDITQSLRATQAQKDEAIAQSAQLRAQALQMRKQNTKDIIIQPATVFDARLTLTIPILNLPAYSLIRNSYIAIEQEEALFKNTKTQIASAVIKAYFQALSSENLLISAFNQLSRTKNQLVDIKGKNQSLLVRNLDLKRLEIEQTKARQHITAAQKNHDFSLGALGILIGQEESFLLEKNLLVKNMESQYSNSAMIEQALTKREDLKAQKTSIKNALQSKLGAYLEFLPTLNLIGQGLYSSNDSGFVSEHWRGAIMLEANISLYDGGSRYAKLRSAQSQLRQAKIKLNDLERIIAAELNAKLTDIAAKKSLFEAKKSSLSLYKAIYQQTQSNLKNGLGDTTDFIDASHNLRDEEINIVTAKRDLDLARVDLAVIIGDWKLAFN